MEQQFYISFSSPFDNFTFVGKENGSKFLLQRIYLSDQELKSEVKALNSFKQIKFAPSSTIKLLGEG